MKWNEKVWLCLKRWMIQLVVVSLCLCACAKEAGSISTSNLPPSDGTKVNQARCGDGICDGPENPRSCPADCEVKDISEGSPEVVNTPDVDLPNEGIPPLYFFYAIHVHASGDYLPYAGPAMEEIQPEIAENMIAAVEDLAEILNRYGVKGTWEALPSVATGLCNYQGENHIFRTLINQGHEVGAHAHRIDDIGNAYDALVEECGITPKTNSGFIAQISSYEAAQAQSAMSLAIQTSLNFGMRIGTTNLSPGGGKNPFTELCESRIGPYNDMWMQTGNLMFPWYPDYTLGDICAQDHEGDMLLVDHVSIEWILLPGEGDVPDILTEDHFNQLQGWFESALSFMEDKEPTHLAVWGFVTHITEYTKGSRAEHPLDPGALAALDQFLAYVSSKAEAGRVIFATVEEIADLVAQDP